MGKKRVFEYKIKSLAEMFPCVAIIGARQCGKSTMVRMCFPDWKYYDLERPDDFELISQDPIRFFELHPEKVIIDEAQQYPELFQILRSVIDIDRKNKGRFILTGSSSPEIIKGLTESLAGRVATVEMAPFKASEYHSKPLSQFYDMLSRENLSPNDFMKLSTDLSLSNVLNFWFTGGYPEPSLDENPQFRKQWMDNYIADYFNRDIRRLFPKLNLQRFRKFVSLLAYQSGSQLNYSDIARALEVDQKTIKDYLDIVHNTFIWRNLSPFEKNPLKKVQKSNKGFLRDSGLLHYLLKIKSLDDLLIHPCAGNSFESFVIEEIIRGLRSTMQSNLDFHYYRTVDKSEIDLIIDSENGPIPIEIKLGSVTSKKMLKGLKTFMSDTKATCGILINNARRVEPLTPEIIQIPVNYL